MTLLTRSNLALASTLLVTAACYGGTGTMASSTGTGDGGDGNGDAGSSSPSATDDAAAIPDVPLVCTSNVTWTRGNHGSSQMHPGQACIHCHSTSDGPSFAIGGTVFPTVREPDDCDGIAGTSATKVVVTDAKGTVLTLAVNAAGNFYGSPSNGALAMPFTAKVVTAAGERAMTTPQSSGDCNSCHTVNGANGAPGRITAP